VALLLVAVLHFVPDQDDPWRIVATLRDALAPGSYLVLCHACRDARPELAAPAEKAYEGRVEAQAAIRPREEILRFFDGWEPLDPGLVYLPQWRPDSAADVPEDPRRFWGLAGVARRP
jgi:SAM-dependent methyltransferase